MNGTEASSPTPPDGPPREPVDPRPREDPNAAPHPTPIDTPRVPQPRKVMLSLLDAEIARLMKLAETRH